MRAELFCATDGRTDRREETNSLRDFAKAPKSGPFVVRVGNHWRKMGAELVAREGSN